MKTHKLKIRGNYLRDILLRGKSFEVRKNDRNFKEGDLIEFVQQRNNKRDIFFPGKFLFEIKYILKGGHYGISEDYCVMSIERLCDEIPLYEPIPIFKGSISSSRESNLQFVVFVLLVLFLIMSFMIYKTI